MSTEANLDYGSDGSEMAINVPKRKRIIQLLEAVEGKDSDEEQVTSNVRNATGSLIPEVDSFLDPTLNEELIDVNSLIDRMEDPLFSIEDDDMGDSATMPQDSVKPNKKKNKKPSEKRAPNSKKALMEVKKVTDTMLREAPLVIEDAILKEPAHNYSFSGFIQRFQSASEKRIVHENEVKSRGHEEASRNTPLTKAQRKEKVIKDIASELRKISKKPVSVLTPMINLEKKRAPVKKKPVKKALTFPELNAALIDLMADRARKLKESVALEESIKEELSDGIVLSTDEEPGTESESEQSDSDDSTVEKASNNSCEKPVDSTQPLKETPDLSATLLPEDRTLDLIGSGQTQIISHTAVSDTGISRPANGDAFFTSASDLLESIEEVKLLNITREDLCSEPFADPSLSSSVQNTKILTTTLEDDSDEEIVVRKVSKRQKQFDSDEEADSSLTEKAGLPSSPIRNQYLADQSDEEAGSLLKRLVKKDLAIKGRRSSPIRNQFVADQADEEDEEGLVIQYSGTEEESDNEYDLDDLETGSDIGSVNQDDLRQLHHKYEKDAENKGYNRLTRRRVGANRILGDDDEAHQLARRQRNRFAAHLKHDQVSDIGVGDVPPEELLTADFIPTGVNRLNRLLLRIPRSKTAREKSTLHSGLSAAQVALAWNDPNPRNSFQRASNSQSSTAKQPKISSFVNRAAHQHNLLNRSSSISSGASTPTKAALPAMQNPLPTFLKGHPTSSLTIADPVERETHRSQLKRQLDTKVPEGLITKLSTTNARRFGYGNFKIHGKRSAFPELFPDAQKKA